MAKELKLGKYCQWCYKEIVNVAIDQGKGVNSGSIDKDTTNVESCDVCGKEAICVVTRFYDIKTVKILYCAYDKERVCDETCPAFVKDKEFLYSELHFDKSNVVPQFGWKKILVVKGNWCSRLQDNIGKFKIIKSTKDGEVIEHEEKD